MKRSLRKGKSSVGLEYSNGEDTIGADTFEIETLNKVATLSFRLCPVDDNQRDDEDNLFAKELLAVHIDDEYIIENISNYLKHHTSSSLRLQILSRGENMSFSIAPGGISINRFSLIIQGGDG